MNQNIHIWAAPDGSRATMSIVSAEITRSDIDTEIAFLSIVNGICSDDIDAALRKMKDTGEPQHNITVAKADQISVNVLGERINIDPPVERALEIGKNISQQEVNGKIVYTASSDGILNLKDHFVEILDVLKIAADIGPQIGNIHSEKDVIINGNVLGGFTVECHETLIIDGTIENGSTIIGNSNALLRQGVFGEKTKVFIKGDAEIGFIQDCNVHVEGNLHVKKFIYNSRVYCGGKHTVDGWYG